MKNVLGQISIKKLRYPALVCILGVISKCDLFRYDEFQDFMGSLFSFFTRNHRALGYLSDLDTTLLLFHRIATLYMSRPSSVLTNTLNTDCSQMKHTLELLTLLGASVDKVSQMADYRPSCSKTEGGAKHMKSLNNLVQSVFLIHEYDRDLIFRLPLDKLTKLKSILSEDSISQQHGCEYGPDENGSGTSKPNALTTNHLNNTSLLHLKIQNVLTAVVNSDAAGINTDDMGSKGVYRKDAYGRKDVKRVLNEIRVGSSLYFIDLLVV
nr:hypothetical protein MACL_00002912 [Theileria orientalis]